MSLLVFDGTEQNFTGVIQKFAMEKKNIFFYAVKTFENEITWHQVIALRTGISVNKIKFLENSVIDDSYFDLRGLKIRSVDLDWEPYVSVLFIVDAFELEQNEPQRPPSCLGAGCKPYIFCDYPLQAST